jgi:hypothetical protein
LFALIPKPFCGFQFPFLRWFCLLLRFPTTACKGARTVSLTSFPEKIMENSLNFAVVVNCWLLLCFKCASELEVWAPISKKIAKKPLPCQKHRLFEASRTKFNGRPQRGAAKVSFRF